jgi:hypothetical protein
MQMPWFRHSNFVIEAIEKLQCDTGFQPVLAMRESASDGFR